MNKLLNCTVVAGILVASGILVEEGNAKYTGPGKQYEIMTIEEVLEAPDDTLAIVDGYIVNQVNTDEYMFKDKNGDILIIEVDDDVIWPTTIDETIMVRLNGEVDTEWNSPSELEVDYIQLL